MSKSVYFDGYYYATLDFAEPDGPITVPTNSDFIELLAGWEIAPNEPEIVQEVIGKHTWQSLVIIVADDTGYLTKDHPRGAGVSWPKEQKHIKSKIQKQGNAYNFKRNGKENIRCMIRTLGRSGASAHRSQMTAELWTSKRFTDCVIAWADAEEPCHRAVLAAASPVFEKMLSSGMEESVQKRIVIKDVQADVGQAMLRFMYQGELDRDFKRPIDLLCTAHMYQIETLVAESAELVLNKLDRSCVAEAVHALKNLRDHPEIEEVWSSVKKRLQEDPGLLEAAMMSM